MTRPNNGMMGAAALALVAALVAAPVAPAMAQTSDHGHPPAGKADAPAKAADDAKMAPGESQDITARLSGGDPGWEGMAFIGGGSRNKVWVVDARFHDLVSTIDVTGPVNEKTKPQNYPNLRDVHAMVWSKDFETMYTVNWYDYDKPSQVIAYDPKTFQEKWRAEAGIGGHHAALTPDDKFLYVANQYADTVSVIDTTAKKKVKDIKTGQGNDYISPSMYWGGKAIDTPYLYVSVHKGGNKQAGTVYVIDWKKHEVVKALELGGMVHGVNISPDGREVWAAVMGEDDVVVIDAKTHEIKHRIDTANSPIHISFSPDSKHVYFTTFGNEIFKIDRQSYETVWKQKGTTLPAHTGITPDGSELWTLNHGMSTERYPYRLGGNVIGGVQIWDTETGALKDEITAEGTPHEIQFVPYDAIGRLQIAQAVDDGQPHAQARNLFGQICYACHGTHLEGASGPNLTEVGTRLNQKQIFNTIRRGRGSMPGGLVHPGDAELLAAWLSEQRGKDDQKTQQGAQTQGATPAGQKAN